MVYYVLFEKVSLYRPLRTRRALSLFNLYSIENQKGAIAIDFVRNIALDFVRNIALLFLNRNSDNGLLALNWRYVYVWKPPKNNT